MHKLVSNSIFAGGPPNLKGIIYFDLLFCHNHSLTKPNIAPSLSEVGDLSCITSCLVLPGFLVDTLLSYMTRLDQLRVKNLTNYKIESIHPVKSVTLGCNNR